jgi:hypothetical protein
MRAPCPMCGSNRHRKTDSQTTFQVLASRQCRDCGHVWEPASPRWLLKVGLIVGVAWVALGAFLAFGGPLLGGGRFDPRFLWLCAAGITAIVGCWYRLRGAEASAGTPHPCPPDHGRDS